MTLAKARGKAVLGSGSRSSPDGPCAEDVSCFPAVVRLLTSFSPGYLCVFDVFVYAECFVVLNSSQLICIRPEQCYLSPVLIVYEMTEMCLHQPGFSLGYPIGSTYVYDHKHVKIPK